MSLAAILNSARSALVTHQLASTITSHNIANVETEGYTRQRVNLSSNLPRQTTYGQVGTGVRLEGVTRMREGLLDNAVRREGGKAASYGMRTQLLQQAEGLFAEPGDAGIAASLDAFWGSWSDLAEAPTSNSARLMVRQRGGQLAGALNLAATRLNEIESGVRLQVTETVDTLNSLARQIAAVNDEIMAAEVGGIAPANDLRDERDRFLDQLSKLGSTQVVQQADGTVIVNLDGSPFVQGGTYQTLSADVVAGTQIVARANGQQLSFPASGSVLGEMVNFLNGDVPAIRADLDTMARQLVLTVNDIHETGWTAAGGTGVRFFEEPADPTTITARNVSLSAAVLADHSVVAASGVVNGPGDNSVAIALSALRDDTTVVTSGAGTTSFADFYRGVVTGVALDLAAAKNSTRAYETLASQAETRRESVSGVSVDEELVSLVQHQQAYTAATRLVTTVDEMMQSLLNMV